MVQTETPDRQTVRCCAIKHQIRVTVGLEQFAENLLRLRGNCVRAVADNVPWAQTLKRFQDFRANAGVIVARKLAPIIETPHGNIVKRDKLARQRNLELRSGEAFPTVSVDLWKKKWF